ncbi:MAG: hypothetical protein WBD81_15710 [Collimonas pratensis]|uniref:hypothetical protein n=1 Tax=Collimonas pratensis TaxID=279113 RepID=UPI003C70F0EC
MAPFALAFKRYLVLALKYLQDQIFSSIWQETFSCQLANGPFTTLYSCFFFAARNAEINGFKSVRNTKNPHQHKARSGFLYVAGLLEIGGLV